MDRLEQWLWGTPRDLGLLAARLVLLFIVVLIARSTLTPDDWRGRAIPSPASIAVEWWSAILPFGPIGLAVVVVFVGSLVFLAVAGFLEERLGAKRWQDLDDYMKDPFPGIGMTLEGRERWARGVAWRKSGLDRRHPLRECATACVQVAALGAGAAVALTVIVVVLHVFARLTLALF